MGQLRAAVIQLRNRQGFVDSDDARFEEIWEALRVIEISLDPPALLGPDPLEGTYDYDSFRRGEAPSWARRH